MSFELTFVGGPTALIAYGGVRFLTDPAFSAPGEYSGLTKTTEPALAAESLEPFDVVLLSHDHHADNLDPAGRELLPRAGRVLTTVAGAGRLGGIAVGLEPWSSTEAGAVTVTAVPAEHGPPGVHEQTGPVVGFVLRAAGEPSVYVSGDNASLDVVRDVAARLGPVDVAVLFAGSAQVPARYGDASLTLTSDGAAEAAGILGARTAIPLHFDGWGHFSQGADTLPTAFAAHGLQDRLRLPRPGETIAL